MPGRYTIEHPRSVRLDEFDPDDTGGMKKAEAEAELRRLGARLAELQESLYGAAQHAVLIVLQGLDTSGKDGTIKHVIGGVNPVGCQVWPFKQPTPDELAHDFLWRIHRRTPAKGMLAIFNRSHYEDVLVARVHELVPEEVWRERYDQISAFERLLTQSGTILLKFYLHISKDEQKDRLLAREKDPEKAWKLSVGDWEERTRWDAYTRAYEAALGRCAAPDAPWYIVPADKKWYRNLFVARTLVEKLSVHEPQWKAALAERGRREREALDAADVHGR